MSLKKKGIAASSGIAIAKAYKLSDRVLTVLKVKAENSDDQIKKFHHALALSQKEVLVLKDYTAEKLGEEEALIFDAQVYMLQDPMLIDLVEKKIRQDFTTAAFAFQTVMLDMMEQLNTIDNDYMKERVIDLKDITARVLNNLEQEKTKDSLSELYEEVILVAEDLTPSDTARLDTKFIKGIVTATGGKTSHSAILARSLGIPAVVGVGTLSLLKEGIFLAIDGSEGRIVIEPTHDEVLEYQEKLEAYTLKKESWKTLKNKPGSTKDGHHIKIAANIGSADDIKQVLDHNAEAVGLYRTEFLYMQSTKVPTEMMQRNSYQTVLEQMEGKDVVIRTLDIGGDKNLPYLPQTKEENPFLGHRALRLSLSEIQLFKTQIRALLLANTKGNLHMMLPMVSTLDELRKAKQLIFETREALTNEGHDILDFKIGIMIEVPSAALFAEVLAKEVDFFSIGTNDLIQYLFAADRMNEMVSYLYQPYHPVVLKTIKYIIDAAHKNHIWVGVCGEMGSHPKTALLLSGLGIDELSMNPASIPEVKWYLNQFTKKELEDLANKALKLETNEQVHNLISDRLSQMHP